MAPRPHRGVRREGPTLVTGGVKHGFTGAMYRSVDVDRVEVEMPDGRRGLFDSEGRWIEGELYEADPELCVWVGGHRVETSHRLSPQD